MFKIYSLKISQKPTQASIDKIKNLHHKLKICIVIESKFSKELP